MTEISGKGFKVPSMESLKSTYEKSLEVGSKLEEVRPEFENRIKQLRDKDLIAIYKSLNTLIALSAYNLATSLAIIKEMPKGGFPSNDQVNEQGQHIDLIEDIIEGLSSNLDSLRKRINS